MKTHRLQQLADALSLTINRLEKETGVKQSRIARVIQRDGDISYDLADEIVKRFTNINRDWLLTGKGDMFTNSPSTHAKITKTSEPDASYGQWKEGVSGEMLYRIIKDMGDLERRVAELERKAKD